MLHKKVRQSANFPNGTEPLSARLENPKNTRPKKFHKKVPVKYCMNLRHVNVCLSATAANRNDEKIRHNYYNIRTKKKPFLNPD